MSFDKKKRDRIKKYILDKIAAGNTDYVKRSVNAFEITSTTVYRYLKELETEGVLEKKGVKYELKTSLRSVLLTRKKGELKNEDYIYKKYIRESFINKKENVRRIWIYAFTEMMNNAIDHSGASEVRLVIGENHMNTIIMIYDNGIGIFKKIKDYLNLETEEDAAKELFKGKFTTDSQRHSGEGIFFTSRLMDTFAAISDGIIFSHEKYDEVVEDLENIKMTEDWKELKGTIIYMCLSDNSRRKTKEIFDKYADVEEGFIRTSVKIKNIFDDYPVSRSQAKRLVNGFERFADVELDFTDIDEIGQGFADELFRVFPKVHPEVKLVPINMCKDVEKMYKHVCQ